MICPRIMIAIFVGSIVVPYLLLIVVALGLNEHDLEAKVIALLIFAAASGVFLCYMGI
jgi:hypothetical protein